ncbi:hypothetical protein [Neorhodopirellula lusitana]|uniref:hypothetical protein n=1 Tax=Neorhodopirellula lusitana TaxID=445327 RepID=UPI00384E34AB
MKKRTSRIYDARDRQVSTTNRVSGTVQFAYDDICNQLSLSDAQGQVTSDG